MIEGKWILIIFFNFLEKCFLYNEPMWTLWLWDAHERFAEYFIIYYISMRWNLGRETTVTTSLASLIFEEIIVISQTLTSIGNVHMQWKNNAICWRSKNQLASLWPTLLRILFSMPLMDLWTILQTFEFCEVFNSFKEPWTETNYFVIFFLS